MTTTYTFDQLKEDVRKEAEALRVHATSEELGKLNLADLDPESPIRCYYGLMTGSCTSPRAHELITKCCVCMIDNHVFNYADPDTIKSIKEYKPMEAKKLNEVRQSDDYVTWLDYISPIEAYILLPEARNANLIAFLRGETDNLEL